MSRLNHLAEILRPGRVLSAEDVELLSAKLEPTSKVKRRKRDRRAAAVLACFQRVPDMPVTDAARLIETELNRFVASAAWQIMQAGRRPAPATSPLADAVRVLALAHKTFSPNRDPLGVRSLLDIRLKATNG